MSELQHIRIEMLVRKDNILDKNINILVRELDAKSRENR